MQHMFSVVSSMVRVSIRLSVWLIVVMHTYLCYCPLSSSLVRRCCKHKTTGVNEPKSPASDAL